MSFSTWSNDDCDSPDWAAIQAAVTSLAQSANAIAVDLQAPANAFCAWVNQVEIKIRRRIDNQTKALIKRLDEAVAIVVEPLTQSAAAMVDAILGTVRYVHEAILASGNTTPSLPPLLGQLPAGLAAAGAASILPFELPAESAPSAVPTADNVYTSAPESTIMPEPECQTACPPGTVPSTPLPEPHDVDDGHLVILADKNQTWHQQLRAWYSGALDSVLLPQTLQEVIEAREQRERESRDSESYLIGERASTLPRI